MPNEVVYYESTPERSGYALAPEGAGAVAPVLVVLPEEEGSHYYVYDVPKRAEGGGHTFRDKK